MPVSYETMPLHQLYCHQGVYELITHEIRRQNPGWHYDMEVLLGFHNEEAYQTIDDLGKDICKALKCSVQILNKNMPLYKFGENGQHYAFELFLSSYRKSKKPIAGAARAAAFFWTYMARQFTYDKLPMTEEQFSEKFKTIVQSMGIQYGSEESVYVSFLNGGGMSGGIVNGRFAEGCLDLLLERLRKYK